MHGYDMALIDELTKLNSKLQIQLDEISSEHIVAANWNQDGHYDISVTFTHDRGKIVMGSDFKTNRDVFDQSELRGDFDSEESFEEWLDDFAYEHNIVTFYRPGLEIFSKLKDKEKKDIGMDIELEDGPVYSCERVRVRDVVKLKKSIIRNDLPFYFID
jgi:hypothetical protein